jgi:hypothetical protein
MSIEITETRNLVEITESPKNVVEITENRYEVTISSDDISVVTVLETRDVSTPESTVIVVSMPEKEIVEVGISGPQGPPGEVSGTVDGGTW